jgi:hypothetical protein
MPRTDCTRPDRDLGNSSFPARPLRPLVPWEKVEQLLADARREVGAAERASIARLLESTVEALGNERACRSDRIQLLAGYLRSIADSAALMVRQGNRAHVLDKLTADLDAMVFTLSEPGEPS